MRIILAYANLATLAFAADPPWNKLGTCFTPQGTLCRTIEYKVTTWAVPGYGFNRLTAREVYAFRSDGAMYESHSGQRFRYFLIPQLASDRKWFFLPETQQTTTIYGESKAYTVASGVRGGFTVWTSDDPDCSGYAKTRLLANLTKGRDTIIAGLRTTQYSVEQPSGTITTVYTAPSIGCTLMKEAWYVKNDVGIVVSAGQTEATSFKIGEPDPRFFQIPTGYHPRPKR